MELIIRYLNYGDLLDDKLKARKLQFKIAYYYLIEEIVLYKHDFTAPYLHCLSFKEANYVMKEIHKGICGYYSNGRVLAYKIIRQGYYWPMIHVDSM